MKLILSLAIGLISSASYAFPEAPFDALSEEALNNVNKTRSTEYNFEGIVKLSNCSGSLVRFTGMPKSAKAVVMTNGHCIQKPGGYLQPGEVWSNRPMKRAMKIFDKNMNLFPIESTQISYATMTGSDLAFYELKETYADIEKNFKIKPLLLSKARPSIAQPIEIISGYWDRGYSCAIDNFVFQIKEDQWTWTDSIRYTAGCDTIGGTSGSPLIAKGKRIAIGVNNTSNESGNRCTMNNPCEVSANGQIFAEKGVRYGQQTYQTYNCLTADFKIDLTIAGCDLPK